MKLSLKPFDFVNFTHLWHKPMRWEALACGVP